MNEKVQNFRDWFADYTSNYVVIGGTACSVLGDDLGFSFRSTKDIDLVLVNDQLSDAFSERFWKYIDEAGYSYRACSNGLPKLYRFQKPLNSGKFPTDSKDVKKHRRDVLELCDTLPSEAVFRIEESVLNDVLQFTSNMDLEATFTPDAKQKSRLDKVVSIL